MQVTEADDRDLTWCVWEEDWPTLLPRTDYVGLVREDGAKLMRAWDTVESVCGPFKLDERMSPPRYLASRSPGVEAWRKLEAEGENPFA